MPALSTTGIISERVSSLPGDNAWVAFLRKIKGTTAQEVGGSPLWLAPLQNAMQKCTQDLLDAA